MVIKVHVIIRRSIVLTWMLDRNRLTVARDIIEEHEGDIVITTIITMTTT